MELPTTDSLPAGCSLSSGLCPTVIKLVGFFIVYRIGVVGNREMPRFLCMSARSGDMAVCSQEKERDPGRAAPEWPHN